MPRWSRRKYLPGTRPARRIALRLVGLSLLLSQAGAAQAAADPALLAIRDLDRRLARISFRLATRNVALCPVTTTWSGLLLHDINEYAPAFRSSVRDTFGLVDTLPAVLATVEGSPASVAGIAEDETITSIDDRPLAPVEVMRRATMASVNAVQAQLQKALDAGPVRLALVAGDRRSTAVLEGVRGCASRVELLPGPGLSAAADGETVQVSGALAEFVRNDDELAILAGHEMAHNILRHPEILKAAGVRHGLLGSFGKDAARIRETEVAADYLGLYLAARAGYDISSAIGFWERFGRRTSWGIFNSPTHPGWKKRQEMVKTTMAEIAAQTAQGRELFPDPARIGR